MWRPLIHWLYVAALTVAIGPGLLSSTRSDCAAAEQPRAKAETSARPSSGVRLERVGQMIPGDVDDPIAALAVQGKYAYLAGFELRVVEVSEPSRPRAVGSCRVTEVIGDRALAVSGNYAYVTVVSQQGGHLLDRACPL